MSKTDHLHLFQGYGIELELMIVDKTTLAVRPFTDFVLAKVAGKIVNEVSVGALAWSNELVMHVIELKTDGPAKTLKGLDKAFASDVAKINAILAEKNAMLMPTAMHPLMNPLKDTQLWSHDDATIYETYDRIFGCKGHGWSNLQSIHINLPFHDDQEFGKLHAAIRLVLPLLPGLAASSPAYEGKLSGLMDNRLEFYRHNQKAVPSVTGSIVPEPAFTAKEYDDKIYSRLRKDIAPHDPDGVLEDYWLNSRGAIARFDRNAIEIRLLDIQESPRMDLAVITTVVSAVKALVDGVFIPYEKQKAWPEEVLEAELLEGIKRGSDAPVKNPEYRAVFGMDPGEDATAGDVWKHIVKTLHLKGGYPIDFCHEDVLYLLTRGCLAKAIARRLGPAPGLAKIQEVYGSLCETLAVGGRF